MARYVGTRQLVHIDAHRLGTYEPLDPWDYVEDPRVIVVQWSYHPRLIVQKSGGSLVQLIPSELVNFP